MYSNAFDKLFDEFGISDKAQVFEDSEETMDFLKDLALDAVNANSGSNSTQVQTADSIFLSGLADSESPIKGLFSSITDKLNKVQDDVKNILSKMANSINDEIEEQRPTLQTISNVNNFFANDFKDDVVSKTQEITNKFKENMKELLDDNDMESFSFKLRANFDKNIFDKVELNDKQENIVEQKLVENVTQTPQVENNKSAIGMEQDNNVPSADDIVVPTTSTSLEVEVVPTTPPVDDIVVPTSPSGIEDEYDSPF